VLDVQKGSVVRLGCVCIHPITRPRLAQAFGRFSFSEICRRFGACGGLVCVRIHPMDTAPPTPLRSDVEIAAPVRRYRRARAYRNGELICGRVELIVRQDTRIGLAPRERRQLVARFVDRLAPTFRQELEQLVRRRGAAASRIGDRIETIELVFDDLQRDSELLVGRLEPPQARRWKLSENEFVIREHR
jgi:hypothetical protein